MEQYALSKEEVFRKCGSSEAGLSQAEAARRLAADGRNVLKEGKKRSKIGLFLAQFTDLMTVILICAAVLSAALAFVTKDGAELADTGILLFVILLNAVVGFLQQYKADAAIEKLKKLSACEAKAVRDGKLVRLDAEELVPPAENLPLEFDPKCAWALRNMHLFPVEVNRAPLETLLRVPGIGARSAQKILSARRYTTLTFEHLRKMRVVLKRARHFITAGGKFYGAKNELSVRGLLAAGESQSNATQLSLFESGTALSVHTGEL